MSVTSFPSELTFFISLLLLIPALIQVVAILLMQLCMVATSKGFSVVSSADNPLTIVSSEDSDEDVFLPPRKKKYIPPPIHRESRQPILKPVASLF